jgi:hypothetical protein
VKIESLLLSTTIVRTMSGEQPLTNATGFFFARDKRLFLVTNRHVLLDERGNHRPDRLLIELHVAPDNVALTTQFSIPLYRGVEPVWREAADNSGTIDVAAVELDRAALPATLVFHAFTPAHLLDALDRIEAGASILIVGFPLGFHDTLHRLPVVRQAVVASAFGMRFQGNGCFLTDARLHRGASGAPVVARASKRGSGRRQLPWLLLGVHATRMDVSNRDPDQDERLDLNVAWYADVLLPLTRRAETGDPTAGPGRKTAD